MGRNCPSGQYWETLLQDCFSCHRVCKEQHVNNKCTTYCESASCKAHPGHYYDLLLKKCVRCADVCGSHPAECSQHCHKIISPSLPLSTKHPVTTKKFLTPPVTTKKFQTPPVTTQRFLTPPVATTKLLLKITSQVPNSREIAVPAALEDSTMVLYSLLALCIVLLFSSLSLAMAVLLRMARAKNSKTEPKEANHNRASLVQPGQEVGGLGQRSNSKLDFLANSNSTTEREPSNDSSPTETCICVHCFPDIKAKDQGNNRPPRTHFSIYQQPVFQRAQIQNGGPVWTEENIYTPGLEVQEAAVGQGSIAVLQNNWNGLIGS